MECFDLFIEATHCDIFKQVRLADTGIQIVFNSKNFFVGCLLKLKICHENEYFALVLLF